MTEPLKIGDWLKDNEMWHADGVMVVQRIDDDRVALEGVFAGKTRKTIVARRRIHLDDKPRRSGWSRVEADAGHPVALGKDVRQ